MKTTWWARKLKTKQETEGLLTKRQRTCILVDTLPIISSNLSLRAFLMGLSKAKINPNIAHKPKKWLPMDELYGRKKWIFTIVPSHLWHCLFAIFFFFFFYYFAFWNLISSLFLFSLFCSAPWLSKPWDSSILCLNPV